MAWYDISTDLLAEAGEKIQSFADDLSALRERLDGILFDLPEDNSIFLQQKQISGNLLDVYVYAGALGHTLFEIMEIYAGAERSAFAGDVYAAEKIEPPPKATPPPIIRQSRGVLLFGDLIMPDWLQAAVLKYEQAHLDPI